MPGGCGLPAQTALYLIRARGIFASTALVLLAGRACHERHKLRPCHRHPIAARCGMVQADGPLRDGLFLPPTDRLRPRLRTRENSHRRPRAQPEAIRFPAAARNRRRRRLAEIPLVLRERMPTPAQTTRSLFSRIAVISTCGP